MTVVELLFELLWSLHRLYMIFYRHTCWSPGILWRLSSLYKIILCWNVY